MSYFTSNRNCDTEFCLADVFCCRPENNTYVKAEIVDRISTTSDEESIFISPDEKYVIFCSYTGNKTGTDLFISYRDINKHWTEPQIFNSVINTEMWERRPFVSFDNKFLFFTRLNITEDGLQESDIYWVKTDKIFKPYLSNSLKDYTIAKGKHFTYEIPKNTFVDVDGDKLECQLIADTLSWLKFDSKTMILSGTPIKKGKFKITIRATDDNGNSTDGQFILVAK